MAKNRGDLAQLGAVHRTIPKRFVDVAVTASNGARSLADFAGQWIWLKAIGNDVTIRLGNDAIATAGEGLVLGTSDSYQEFYVDPNDDLALAHRATAAATLRILYD